MRLPVILAIITSIAFTVFVLTRLNIHPLFTLGVSTVISITPIFAVISTMAVNAAIRQKSLYSNAANSAMIGFMIILPLAAYLAPIGGVAIGLTAGGICSFLLRNKAM